MSDNDSNSPDWDGMSQAELADVMLEVIAGEKAELGALLQERDERLARLEARMAERERAAMGVPSPLDGAAAEELPAQWQ